MSRRPSSYEYEERRNARIRQLREQREGPVRRRRRVEPLLLLVWIAGSIALLAVALFIGFNAIFAPRVMAWVEENPRAIEHVTEHDHSHEDARRVHVSMERNMKCAVGHCGHCQLGPEFVCRDGPVFTFERMRAARCLR